MISIVIGTRPEIIKMAPVMRELERRGLSFDFVHTNQHYSKELDANIISDLQLSLPDHNLHIGSLSHAAQTGRAMEQLEMLFSERRPSLVLVHGDTNTTLAGAIAAKKMHIPVGHIESGLRSFDTNMPEEINRMLVDRISDLLFAPTETAKKNLLNEGYKESSVIVCGNTVVDAMNEHQQLAKNSDVMDRFEIGAQKYILATLHRPETVDSTETLQRAIEVLAHASKSLNLPVLLPAHPRTKKQIESSDITIPSYIRVFDPVGYIDMIALLSGAKLVMTDSGGLQEEAYILQKPLMTMRDSTERPETLSANFLIADSKEQFDKAWSEYKDGKVSWQDEFGSGDTSKKIVDTIIKFLHEV